MKKYLFWGLTLSLLTSSCSQNDQSADHQTIIEEDSKQITFSVLPFEWQDVTRTAAEMTSTGVTFKWAPNDTIGIFPNVGSQVAFPIETGTDAGNATFNGGGWALKENSTYKAYWPYNRFQFDQDNIILDYTNQLQVGNDNMDNLTKCDYLVSSLTTPESGTVHFNFEHIGALVRFILNLPEVDNFYQMDFTVGFGTAETMKLDLSGSSYELSPNTYSKKSTYTIKLKDVSNTPDNKSVTIYCMLPPAWYGAVTVVTLYGEKNLYQGILDGTKKYESGKAYTYSDDLAIYEPEDPFNGYDYVDLGLPSGTLWATCNVGASTPEGEGDYYAWGETEPKDWYGHSTYSFWVGPDDYDYGAPPSTDGIINPQYDAARVNMGGKWRMPTIEQMFELRASPSSYTTVNGVAGQLFESTNGNTLFLPAYGFYDENHHWTPSTGFYFYPSCSYPMKWLCGNQFGIAVNGDYDKAWGCQVRGVCIP